MRVPMFNAAVKVGVARVRAVAALTEADCWAGPVVRRASAWFGCVVVCLVAAHLFVVGLLVMDDDAAPDVLILLAVMDAGILVWVPVMLAVHGMTWWLAELSVRRSAADARPPAGTVSALAGPEPVWRVLAPLPEDGTPLKDQVARRVREAVDAGRLRPGEVLPSDGALARHWRVSAATVRRGKHLAANGTGVLLSGGQVDGEGPAGRSNGAAQRGRLALLDALRGGDESWPSN
ncbi:GntR family transcriptional regulator [Dactylosporangium sp. McL0621]|uniref:GntR family transcriptional regulator n=1 Tax=Dactylosporangium sp. McL0621 TaxID=3415678 RepID=UPI003CFA1D90